MSHRFGAADISEALRETAEPYGVTMSVGEQVAVARDLDENGPRLSGADVGRAFVRFGMKQPPAGYGRAVVA
jgi:hypothetical protein